MSSNDVLDPEDRAPFPTLKQVFDALDPHIGFNIEIKYAMEVKVIYCILSTISVQADKLKCF